MAARGDVRTTISGRTPRRSDGAERGLPRLLKEGQPASVNAERLDYSGSNGRAEYRGKATLLQGATPRFAATDRPRPAEGRSGGVRIGPFDARPRHRPDGRARQRDPIQRASRDRDLQLSQLSNRQADGERACAVSPR